MRVLIVEDDAALGLFLARGLKLEGHTVDLVGNGQDGLDHALAHQPDLMVLDLSLPQMDGIEVLEQMHGRFENTSVLILTGRDGVQDRIRCLNLGADDCLLKPFSFNELSARCRALLRRRERFADPALRVGDIELNRIERTVVRDGTTIDLTAKEFALLEYLMLARGRTCARSELLDRVWQATPAAGTNVVDVYVNYLRKKLGAARGRAGAASIGPDRVIETVRGEGYAMVAPTHKKTGLDAFPDTSLTTPGLCAMRAAHAGLPRAEPMRKAEDALPGATQTDWFLKSLHDLCQPLTALECRLSIGSMRGPAGEPAEPAEMEQTIRDSLAQCDRMMTMVRTMQAELQGHG